MNKEDSAVYGELEAAVPLSLALLNVWHHGEWQNCAYWCTTCACFNCVYTVCPASTVSTLCAASTVSTLCVLLQLCLHCVSCEVLTMLCPSLCRQAVQISNGGPPEGEGLPR